MIRSCTVLVLLLCAQIVSAQTECVPKHTVVNIAGNGTEKTVSSTAVQVLPPNDQRCTALLRNSGVNTMRCLPAPQGTPTAARGLIFDTDKQLLMTTESREAWYCIATGANTSAETIEGLP